MRVLLTSERLFYGQDFISRAMADEPGWLKLMPIRGRYALTGLIPDLVVTHNPHDPMHADFLQTLAKGVPVVVHIHLQMDAYTPPMKEALNASMRRATLAVCPADFLKTQVLKEYPELRECVVVRNGVDEGRFRPTRLAERLDFKKRLGVPSDSLLVANIGNLPVEKGRQILEELARLLPDTPIHLLQEYQPPPKTYFDGDNLVNSQLALAYQVKRAGGDSVHLYESDPLGDRPVRYCDAMIQLSLGEVAPMVVVESWMAGVRVVATGSTPFYSEPSAVQFAIQQIPLPERFVRERRDLERREINPGDAYEIAKRTLKLLREMPIPDDTARLKISQAARVEGFSAQQMTSQFRSLYEGQISSAHALRG